MNYRPVVLLTLWTLLIGPVMAFPSSGKGSAARTQTPAAKSDKSIQIPQAQVVGK